MASPIQVGFTDHRSCSRILKPPGGGTSDIFGTERIIKEIKVDQKIPEEPPKVVTEENIANGNGNTVTTNGSADLNKNGEKTNGEQDTNKVEDVKIEELKIENSENDVNVVHKTVTIETKSDYKSSSISNILKQDGAVIDASFPEKKITPNKNRVPPGGYSSGLW